MTSVPLPFPLGAAISSWTLQDWQAPARDSAAGPDGVARIDFGQLDNDVMWLVDRAVVSCTSDSSTSVRLYDSSVGAKQLLSGSASGNFDEAEYPAGLLVRPSTSLLAVWSGCTVGAVATARLQVRLLRRS